MILGLLKADQPMVITVNDFSFACPDTYIATLDNDPILCMCVHAEDDKDVSFPLLEHIAYLIDMDGYDHQG